MERRGIAGDERGAILVTAIVLGAVLLSAALYVLDAGHAIVTRERLQDAADATAFESAVWHARGMNAIAVLNILMSLALAIIAVLRQVELVCMVIPGGQACVQPVLRIEERVTPFVDTSLDVLQRTQIAVAAGTPLHALALSARVPSDFDHDGDPEMRGSALSLALLPVAIDTLLEFAPARRPPREGEPDPGFQRNRIGTAFPVRLPDVLGQGGQAFPSLPVQAGKFSVLCGKSTSFLSGQTEALLDRYADVPGVRQVLSFIGGTFTAPIARPLLDWAGRHFSSLLCQPARQLLDETVRTIADEACNAHEEQRNEERERIQRENEEDGGNRRVPRRWSRRDREQCLDEEESEARNAQNVPSFGAVPADMYALAENGNPFLHTWSRVQTAIPEDAPPSFEPLESVAEAEYYFDCDSAWRGCKGDALWRPGWTARMRRYRMPYDELDLAGFAYNRVAGALQAHAGSFIDAYLESSIESLLSGAACSGTSAASRLCDRAAGRVLDPITRWITDKAEQVVSGRFPTGQAAVENTLGSAAQGGARFGIDWLIQRGRSRIAVPDTRGYHADPRIH